MQGMSQNHDEVRLLQQAVLQQEFGSGCPKTGPSKSIEDAPRRSPGPKRGGMPRGTIVNGFLTLAGRVVGSQSRFPPCGVQFPALRLNTGCVCVHPVPDRSLARGVDEVAVEDHDRLPAGLGRMPITAEVEPPDVLKQSGPQHHYPEGASRVRTIVSRFGKVLWDGLHYL